MGGPQASDPQTAGSQTTSRRLWPRPGQLPEKSQAEADAVSAEHVSFHGRVTGRRAAAGVSACEVSVLPLCEAPAESQRGAGVTVLAGLPGAGGAEGRPTSWSTPSPGARDMLG